MKYIVTNDGQIIIFTGWFTHAEIARRFGGAQSAGFISFGKRPEEIKTYGESVSLNLHSKSEDAEKVIREVRGY